MKRMEAFTLIELLVVLAIVGILAAVAYPGYSSYIVRARRIEGQGALLETMQKQERYYAQNNRYLAFSADSDDGDATLFRWWSGKNAPASAYEISGQACPGLPLQRCIELRAEPGTARVDGKFRDKECETLILRSTGESRATGGSKRCWP